VPDTSLSDKLLGNFAVAPRRAAYVLRTFRIGRYLPSLPERAEGGRKEVMIGSSLVRVGVPRGPYQIKRPRQICPFLHFHQRLINYHGSSKRSPYSGWRATV
jgi:hypothetical protein